MISTDFAPNETWSDAWISLKLIFQPWRWKRGRSESIIKKKILDLVFPGDYHIDDGRTTMAHFFCQVEQFSLIFCIHISSRKILQF